MFHLPIGKRARTWVIGPTGVLGGKDFRAWVRPRGCTMLGIVCIGSGGGGGGGAAATTGNVKGGGGGGGGSAITRMSIPFDCIPERLYILVGSGGAPGDGAASAGNDGSAGGSGRLSRVAVYPHTDASNVLCVSGSSAPTGGAGGQRVGGSQAGGSAGGIASVADMPLASAATSVSFTIGVAGGSGTGSDSAPTGLTPLGSSTIILPGCGGGGSQSAPQAGGGYIAVANSPFIAFPGTSNAPGSDGNVFIGVHYGGIGGGSHNSTAGSNGGSCSRSPGSGGGGGGAGGSAGGKGGRGGPGQVILVCW